MEQHPDFAEDFLYGDNAVLHSCPASSHHQAVKASLFSTASRLATAPLKIANGICPKFSPKDPSPGDATGKKHN